LKGRGLKSIESTTTANEEEAAMGKFLKQDLHQKQQKI
jgi:hypothetical protein